MTRKLHANWTYPTAIHVGPGRLVELPALCRSHAIARPLVVTDAGLAAHPMIARALGLLQEAGLAARLFCEVQGNPVEAHMQAGIRAYLEGGHDGLVAIGGGSALDVAKLVALMARQSIPVWDLEDIGDWWRRADPGVIAPLIAVPTTAGTGSEVGRCAVVTNEGTAEKKIIFHPRMLPVAVIGDPELAAGMPPALTAATGMDALTHAFETFCVDALHPMADGIALESLWLIRHWLPRACAEGGDIEARTMMFAAALMAGVAFQKGLGAVHSIAHPLGALYDVHHGLANGVLLPYVAVFNRPAIEARAARMARTLEVGDGFDDLLAWLLDFRAALGVPHRLADLGIGTERSAEIGRKAQADPSTAANPRLTTPADMERIFRAAVAGDLSLSQAA